MPITIWTGDIVLPKEVSILKYWGKLIPTPSMDLIKYLSHIGWAKHLTKLYTPSLSLHLTASAFMLKTSIDLITIWFQISTLILRQNKYRGKLLEVIVNKQDKAMHQTLSNNGTASF